MTEGHLTFGSDLTKRAVRLVLTVSGLLILRGILGALPVLKNAGTFDGS